MKLAIYKENHDMRKNYFYMFAAMYVTLSLLLLLFPLNSYSAKLFHTIQTASFSSISDAEKQYDSIVMKLDDNQLDHLRIEKIGKYYSVRLGKFMDNTAAEKFFSTVKPKLPGAKVMTAYIKKERIAKLYAPSTPVKVTASKDRTLTSPVPDKKEIKTSNKANKKAGAAQLRDNIKRIEVLVKKKNYTAALDIITANITEHPKHPDLNAWHGMILLKMDKPLEALNYLKKATELSPSVPDYHNGLGYSFFFLDRYDEAIDEFNKAISHDPGHLDALTGLGITYVKINDKGKAMDIYNRMKKIDSETSRQLLAVIEK